ncbi:MAG: HAD family phosphatase [Verrucomicrobiota bacterium]
MSYWAALFDWDGVVVDSSRPHEISWDRLAEAEGLSLPEGHFQKGFGMKNKVIIPELLKWTDDTDEIQRLSDKKEELYREVIREAGIEPLTGVREFLEILKEASVPCVVGTSTDRLNVMTIFEMTGLGDYFKDVVSAENVKRGKPDPEVFQIAAQKAGDFSPEKCVVFEDAQVGVDAGKAAGMKVVGVRGFLKNTDRIVERLDELSLGEIGKWFE